MTNTKVLAAILLLIVLSGCASTWKGLYPKPNRAKLGMTMKEARMAVGSTGDRQSRTEMSGRVYVTWWYDNGWISFTNGIVTSVTTY